MVSLGMAQAWGGNQALHRAALGTPNFMERADNGLGNIILPEMLANTTELDPMVVLYFGRRGDGKTLSMTAALECQRRRYMAAGTRFSEANPNGFKITTNYGCQFADFCDPYIVDMVSGYDERMRRMCIGIDEILSYVPSRRSMARANLDFANFLIQIRKLDIELKATTQFPQNIDSQMLTQIDLFIMPILFNRHWVQERELWTGKYTGKMIYRATAVRLLVWDWWDQHKPAGSGWKRKQWPPTTSGEPHDGQVDIFNLQSLFHQFSTKEQIPSIWHANRQDAVQRGMAAQLQAMKEAMAPDIAEEEAEGVPAATLADLVAAQDDTVDVGDLLKDAQKNGIPSTQREAMILLEAAGYTIVNRGKSAGYLAVRDVAEAKVG